MSVRSNRVAEQVRKEITQMLIKDVNDPRVKAVTVTGVEVTGDLQQATIFYSVLGDETVREEARVGLEKSKGFMRKEIGSRIRLRKTPELIFEIDTSVEYGSRIDELLRNLNKD
ncbi:30S ribosome-binding factor RbfA [Exiguobacterium sp. RIT452]|jgi:ribosome-binding factor A|uniref:Ribosome-binding factor A n=1 Tax=Exiguobacterium undae TaxID=169177 RepID=A0ABX2VBF7_9BACL|nr:MULTISPECIES: 30S ribosome-binding factor RbfA [Exiguobacterium]OAN15119.1 ribosome-binding factor A [Exiguobacterium undae]RJP00392.1 30S ribosome-binding factor RbfA [Exiguobacterium sp. RIT452]